MKIYNRYDVPNSPAQDLGGESPTQQQFANDQDINTIMARYNSTGILPQLKDRPIFGDFSNISDFQTAKFQLVAAENSFKKIKPEVRLAFDNDPGLFLHAMDNADDPEIKEKLQKLGIINKPAPDAPAPAEPLNPA